MKMDRENQITHVIFGAIEEVNQTLAPEQALDRSPATVLIGDAGIDSVAVVNIIVLIEEKLEEIFQEPVSIMDAITAAEGEQWTVAALAQRLSERLDRAA